MPAASGVFKQVAIKKETTYGVLPTASGAQLLRRVDAAFNLTKDTYESNEIRADLQAADMRHGINRVTGNLNGELSPGSYAPYLGSLLKRDFTAVAAITGQSITIAAAAGGAFTVSRATGSWLTSGVKVGHVVRLTAGTFNANNLNKNLFVVAVTALALTVLVLNGTTLTAEGPIASATLSLPGKTTFVPTSGHTDDSYAVEEWFSDVPRSETYTGIKFTQAQIQLPPSGPATLGLTVAGQRMGQAAGGTRYFTSPTAQSASGIAASVNGVLRINGATQLAVTGLNFDINANFTGDGVVGSNVVPQQFAGRLRVSGQFTAYFEDGALADAFYNESQIGLQVALTTGSEAAADFLTFSMSRVKLGGADKSDGEGGVVRTFPFTALLNSNGGASAEHEQTTIAIQDSLA
ncbi:MAG: hypothetical protein KGZ67_04655 [Hydrogenophaga sp.]|jgi:hypothetical protein|nr:hypothetical protein [Hydrogenophaga sp.]